MRVPLSWLKEFVPIDLDPRDAAGIRAFADELSMLGMNVEHVDAVDDELPGVVVARVVEIDAIPGADRIQKVVVDAGGAPTAVVCGAFNFDVGDYVPFATIGARLVGGVEIARKEMRGVASEGMICSGRELGLSSESSGIFVLFSPPKGREGPPVLPLGAPLVAYLGLEKDVVFDLDIEPNRPDALSMIGIARDVAAHRRVGFSVPPVGVEETGLQANRLVSISIAAPDACRRFVARVVTGVATLPAPRDVQRRLILSGMRPINAVVDASNYTMLERGQPTHPYDLDQLGGGGFRVRLAHEGERLVTLDGIERTLGSHRNRRGETKPVEDLLICDANDVAVGLAGIMGGATSEISDSTSNVVIESADFASAFVGATSLRQDLRSEASTRFWRGIDPAGLSPAASRVAQLIVDAHVEQGVAPPIVARGIADAVGLPRSSPSIYVRTNRVNDLLGTELDRGAIRSLLEPIGFSSGKAPKGLAVSAPSFRPDVGREVDVIEEIARHYGYEQIVPTIPRASRVGSLSSYQKDRRRVTLTLVDFGADEAWTRAIVDPERDVIDGEGLRPLKLVNPVVREESALRTNLLAGLLDALRRNVATRNASVRFFEVGKVFRYPGSDDGAPVEREHLGVLLARDGDDARTAIECLRVLEERLRIEAGQLHLKEGSPPPNPEDPVAFGMHPTRLSTLFGGAVGDEVIGVVGEVDPRVLEEFGVSGRRVGWLSVDLERFLTLGRRPERALPVSRFPSSDIDLSFAVPDDVSVERVEEVLRQASGEWFERIELVDVYRGKGLAERERSVSFRIRFSAIDRTLTDDDVAAARARCIAAVEAEVGAALR
ncbi:MAG: phenylalanine--tRNA ligase subunit beta, partial [Acidimicrobiales bacterium]